MNLRDKFASHPIRAVFEKRYLEGGYDGPLSMGATNEKQLFSHARGMAAARLGGIVRDEAYALRAKEIEEIAFEYATDFMKRMKATGHSPDDWKPIPNEKEGA